MKLLLVVLISRMIVLLGIGGKIVWNTLFLQMFRFFPSL